jgi:hypothetical protein
MFVLLSDLLTHSPALLHAGQVFYLLNPLQRTKVCRLAMALSKHNNPLGHLIERLDATAT